MLAFAGFGVYSLDALFGIAVFSAPRVAWSLIGIGVMIALIVSLVRRPVPTPVARLVVRDAFVGASRHPELVEARPATMSFDKLRTGGLRRDALRQAQGDEGQSGMRRAAAYRAFSRDLRAGSAYTRGAPSAAR